MVFLFVNIKIINLSACHGGKGDACRCRSPLVQIGWVTLQNADYEQIIDNINSVILTLSPEGRVKYINRYGLNFFGYQNQDIQNISIYDLLIRPDSKPDPEYLNFVADLLKNPQKYEYHENDNIRSDGKTVWMAWINKAVYKDGKLAEIISVGTDMSQRRQAELTLVEKERWLRLVTDNLPCMVAYIDRQSRFQFVNNGYAEFTGMSNQN